MGDNLRPETLLQETVPTIIRDLRADHADVVVWCRLTDLLLVRWTGAARDRSRQLHDHQPHPGARSDRFCEQAAQQRADALLEQVCLVAEAIPNTEVLLGALALRAVIAGSLHGDPARGLPYLERALNLAGPEGFARPLLDAGGSLGKLLRQAIMQGIRPAFAQKLLADLTDDERRRASASQAPGAWEAPGASRLVEPRTDRKRQVLRLLAAGLSSTEVAEELVISVSTARSYIKSLYGKLDAHSREEAIAHGRQCGLL